MQIVQPYADFPTLVIDHNWMPQMTISSKAALYHMMKNHGVGLDANKMPFRFDDMRKKSLAIYPEQPVMRSAPNPETGEETFWFIPTVFVAGPSFWFRRGQKKWTEKNLPSIKEVFDHYKGVCQRCLRPIKKLADASRDHHIPKKLNGEDGIINITLMHKKCNADLGHSFPKYNVNGELIEPKMKINPNHFTVPYGTKIWPGWTDHAPWLEVHQLDLTKE